MPSPIDPLASVAYTITDTLTWETSTDWDNAVDEQSVVHEAFGDLPGSGTVQLGFPSHDQTTDSNLFGYWHFDEDSGSTAEDVAGSNDGSITGATVGTTGGLYNSTHYAFDGSDDYVDVGNLGFGNPENSFSVSGVILSRNSGGPVAGRYDGSEDLWQVWLSGSDNLEWRIGHVGGNEVNTGTVAISSFPVHVICVWDGINDEGRVYLDGSKETSQAEGNLSDFSDTNPVYFGGRGGSTAFIDANLDAFRIWDKAIDDTEAGWIGDLTSGYLTSATKSFSTATKPDLQNLDYSLNSQSIDVDVIGSPGTADEEVVTQSLDGSTSFSLTWSNSHTDFRVKPQFSTTDITASPTINRLELA